MLQRVSTAPPRPPRYVALLSSPPHRPRPFPYQPVHILRHVPVRHHEQACHPNTARADDRLHNPERQRGRWGNLARDEEQQVVQSEHQRAHRQNLELSFGERIGAHAPLDIQ